MLAHHYVCRARPRERGRASRRPARRARAARRFARRATARSRSTRSLPRSRTTHGRSRSPSDGDRLPALRHGSAALPRERSRARRAPRRPSTGCSPLGRRGAGGRGAGDPRRGSPGSEAERDQADSLSRSAEALAADAAGLAGQGVRPEHGLALPDARRATTSRRSAPAGSARDGDGARARRRADPRPQRTSGRRARRLGEPDAASADLEQALAIGRASGSPEVLRGLHQPRHRSPQRRATSARAWRTTRRRSSSRSASATVRRCVSSGGARIRRVLPRRLGHRVRDRGALRAGSGGRRARTTCLHSMLAFRSAMRIAARTTSRGRSRTRERALELGREAGDPQVLCSRALSAALYARHGRRPARRGERALRGARGRSDADGAGVRAPSSPGRPSSSGREDAFAQAIEQEPGRPLAERAGGPARGRPRSPQPTSTHEGGYLPGEAFARLWAAEKLLAEGRRAEADEQLERALAFWRSVGATRYVAEAEALRAQAATG